MSTTITTYSYAYINMYREYNTDPGIYEYLVSEDDTFAYSFAFTENKCTYSRFLKNKDIIE